MRRIAGTASPPLPYTPCPFPGELLSSWLRRIATEFGISLAHLAHHLGLPVSTPDRIDVGLHEADVRRVAMATRSSDQEIRAMLRQSLKPEVRALVASQRPIQFCPRCRAHHAGMTSEPVAIKAWFEYWQIECAHCRVPFASVTPPNLRRCNLAREDPEWFNRILPAARIGAARLAGFACRPRGVVLAPPLVLNLLSMRLRTNPSLDTAGGCDGNWNWGNSHSIAELFVPGLRERTSPDLIANTWRPSGPVRLVDARTILLAAMTGFFANVRQAFAQITDIASATMTPAIDRWLAKLPTSARALLSGRVVARSSHHVSDLLQL